MLLKKCQAYEPVPFYDEETNLKMRFWQKKAISTIKVTSKSCFDINTGKQFPKILICYYKSN